MTDLEWQTLIREVKNKGEYHILKKRVLIFLSNDIQRVERFKRGNSQTTVRWWYKTK